MGPVLIIATLNLGLAILDEATLSFLGVGLPPTQPSLGTLIHIGNDYLFSGEWWIAIFPGALLALLVLSINLFGDWLRDALNPRNCAEHAAGSRRDLTVEFPDPPGRAEAHSTAVSFAIAPWRGAGRGRAKAGPANRSPGRR